MLITRLSKISGIQHTRDINITEEEFQRVTTSSELIQDILPHLSDDDREFLISGITPEEWADTFKDRVE